MQLQIFVMDWLFCLFNLKLLSRYV